MQMADNHLLIPSELNISFTQQKFWTLHHNLKLWYFHTAFYINLL